MSPAVDASVERDIPSCSRPDTTTPLSRSTPGCAPLREADRCDQDRSRAVRLTNTLTWSMEHEVAVKGPVRVKCHGRATDLTNLDNPPVRLCCWKVGIRAPWLHALMGMVILAHRKRRVTQEISRLSPHGRLSSPEKILDELSVLSSSVRHSSRETGAASTFEETRRCA
jgi:hypothetical protein